MTRPCELCGKPATRRYKLGFQLVACQGCVDLLRQVENWVPISVVLERESIVGIVQEWRALNHVG